MQKLRIAIVTALSGIVALTVTAQDDGGSTGSNVEDLRKEHESIKAGLEGNEKALVGFRTRFQIETWKKFKGVKSAKFYTVGSNAREFTNVVISEINPGGVRITHDQGAASIPCEDLPAAVQDKLHFVPELTQKYRQAEESEKSKATQAAAKQKAEAETALERQKMMDEKYYREKEEKDRRSRIAYLKRGIELAQIQIRDFEDEIWERERKQRIASLRGKSASHTIQVKSLRQKIANLKIQIAEAKAQLDVLED